jgi:hypothetical protein
VKRVSTTPYRSAENLISFEIFILCDKVFEHRVIKFMWCVEFEVPRILDMTFVQTVTSSMLCPLYPKGNIPFASSIGHWVVARNERT